ncbi:MAG: 1-deoxy-D-xylulose-5-phosphate reductoisomerase [Clostridiales bacterium]|nr:1-deoxy-D-xylulose-5-phosphate reductoisomerase [Clostridiales bacterium]
MKKRIAIIGSTGSIGTQTLDILSNYPEHFEIKSLATYQNIDLLEEQIMLFSPSKVVVINEDRARELNTRLLPQNIKVKSGKDALLDLVTDEDIDVVLMAVVGIAGLEPTIAALKAGKNIALANKEVMVTGGHIVNELAKEFGGSIIPVDSEHSAVFQALQGCKDNKEINKIILTASGGPFRGYDSHKLKKVTVEDALKHPNWEMGHKITIDSATLMNKGLEVIEAKWLFDIDVDRIQVLVHPQSIIHSMVEFVDGSLMAQLGMPDMRLPILYALTYPYRFKTNLKPLNLLEIGSLSFEEPDLDNFPCLELAYEAIKLGGTMPVVLNAANEVAVDLFLKRRLAFTDIPIIIEEAMKSHNTIKNPELSDIMAVDQEVRNFLYKKDGGLC